MNLPRALPVSVWLLSGGADARPSWSWSTLPTYIHFANQSGAFDDAALEQMGKQAFVVFEKDQGRWPQGQGQAYPSDYNDRAEDKIELACKQVKAVNSSVQCYMYTEVDWSRTQYTLGHRLDGLETAGATPGMFELMCNGSFVTEWDNKTCEGSTATHLHKS